MAVEPVVGLEAEGVSVFKRPGTARLSCALNFSLGKLVFVPFELLTMEKQVVSG